IWRGLWAGDGGHSNELRGHRQACHHQSRRRRAIGQARRNSLDARKARESPCFPRPPSRLVLVQCVRRFLYVWTGFWNLDPSNLLDEFHGFANVYLTSSLTLAMLLGLWRALRNSGSLRGEASPRPGAALCSDAGSGRHSRSVAGPAFRSSREAVLPHLPYLPVLLIYPRSSI